MAFLRERQKLTWTAHSRAKMRQHRLSEGRVKRVLHSPKRIEEGVAEKTVAMMQPASLAASGLTARWKQEIWVMIQDRKNTRLVISAWRYPGVTKPRDEITTEFLKSHYKEYLDRWSALDT